MHLRKPDSNGEYFFDRSASAFEAVLNFYRQFFPTIKCLLIRTGRLRQPPGVSASMLEDEVDYWQLPQEALYDDIRLGCHFHPFIHSIRQQTISHGHREY